MKRLILILLFSLSFNFLFAQEDPCDPFTGEGCDDPYDPDVPLDGGASILIAAGVAYGLKKYRDNRKVDENKS